ncbi:MAG: hypothetical protein KF894_12965 [Labilithrix sp.]|nr:hypothetical protein [Labilithrix sp.]
MSGRAFQRTRLGRRLVFAAALGAVGCGIGIVGSEPPPVSDADAGREGGFRDPSPPVDAPTGDAPLLCDGAPPDTSENCGACGRDCAGGACDAGTCAPIDLVVVPADQTVRAVAVNGDGLYYLTEQSRTIVRTALDGGGPTDVLTSADATQQIAVDDTYLWYTSTSLWRASTDGSDPVALAVGSYGCVSVDPSKTVVYAADFDGDRIISVPYGGGLASDILTADAGVESPWGVAANATDIFFTTSDGGSGSIATHPKDGDGGTITLKTGQPTPNCLTFDEDGRLYWANYGDGTIHRSKADGGDAVVLATGQTAVTQLAIDAKFYYWGTGNAVRRLAR